MTGGFRAEPAKLAAGAGQFDDLAARAAAIHRDLADRLAATGTCWGTDEVGQSFASTHTTAADAAFGAIEALPERIAGVGTRFADTATAYATTESDAEARLEGTGHGD